jgi:putative transposase
MAGVPDHQVRSENRSLLFRAARSSRAGEKLRELANQHRRFGYRRLHILMCRKAVMINRKKTQRLDQEQDLEVRPIGSRKRAVGSTCG